MSDDLLRTLTAYDDFMAHQCGEGLAGADLRESFAASGLNNWWLPAAHGGAGRPLVDGVRIAEVLAGYDAGLAFAACVSGLGGTIVELAGSQDCRSEVFDHLAQTGAFLATAGSEHAAGSELTRIETTIRAVDDELVVDGAKAFATNAAHARHLVVVGRDGDSRRRFTAAVLDTQQPGVRVTQEWETLGLDSAQTVQLEICGARTRSSMRCDGPGLRILEAGLNVSRTLMAAISVGICVRLQRELMAYAADKEVGGSLLLEHPVFAARIADLEMATQTMRWSVRAAAEAVDAAAEDPDQLLRRGALPEAVIAKSTCGRTGWEQVAGLSTAMGGIGYLMQAPTARALRDMRHVSIIEGGDEVLRELVYRRVVLPRSGTTTSARARTEVLGRA